MSPRQRTGPQTVDRPVSNASLEARPPPGQAGVGIGPVLDQYLAPYSSDNREYQTEIRSTPEPELADDHYQGK
ncbi:hypothetical protein J6590_043797 [Homalodisca vitripennis]|nr:hypothetical protein J6590_043797 [Homalodisca vitripennis]